MNKAESKIILADIEVVADKLREYRGCFEGRTFFITGAGGFLGKYMVALLRYLNESVLQTPAKALFLDNYVVKGDEEIVSDDNLKFINHDVVKHFEADCDIDYIIHAAGIASPMYYTKHPIETMDVTTIGTRRMLDMAHEKRVRSFIFTSSSEVYGDPDNEHVPTPETYNGNVSIRGPRACYDESKRFAEVLCLAYHRVYDVRAKIVRYFNVYGPGIRMNDYRVLPNFMERALKNESLEVHGDGRNTRSYCYVGDAIEATFKVLFSDANGEAFNIGNPSQEISVHELAKVVAEISGLDLEIRLVRPPHDVYAESDPKRRCPDISKIKSVIDYEPQISLKEGIRRTLDWYAEKNT